MKKSSSSEDFFVGTTGFEPAASCTPCKRATGLRYVPRFKQDDIPAGQFLCIKVYETLIRLVFCPGGMQI